MRVILLAEIRGLGNKDDVKDVADGYFRNVLLLKKLAIAATAGALAELNRRKEKAAADKERLVAAIKSVLPEFQKLVLNFKVKTGEKDEVFGSVTRKDVQLALAERGFKDLAVNLEHPLKALGEHEVEIDLGEGVKTKIRVVLEKSE